MIAKQEKIEFIETRWRSWSERPHVGEVFVGRRNQEVYNVLFLAIKGDDVVYLSDNSTHLGQPYDWFTHWLPVGEIKGA